MKRHLPSPISPIASRFSSISERRVAGRRVLAVFATGAVLTLGACASAGDDAGSSDPSSSVSSPSVSSSSVTAAPDAESVSLSGSESATDVGAGSTSASPQAAAPSPAAETAAASTGTAPSADQSEAPTDAPPAGRPEGRGGSDGRGGPDGRGGRGGPGGGFSPASAASATDLNSMLSEAIGDGGLGLHRGHQPITPTLDSVLGISHDELHVRMEQQNQNLAAVATDLGIEPQTLIDGLVAAWSPAIDTVAASGAITADQATQYHDALVEAFTFRVNWNGTDPAPTFTIA